MSDGTPAADLSGWSNVDDDNDALILLNDDLNLDTSSLRSDEKYVGFDNNGGDTWVFPSNFPERAYQFNIVQKALFHNTLVVLPTGLGKTFIAAVVMYNIYRWYPMGKVIFMAPTRPLVAQQIDACRTIMGIPIEDSVEITGKLNKSNRALLWQSKRVFFATPQSVQSDITDGEQSFPFDAIKLIVVDEAHKAKGRYAYTDVVNSIWSKNKYFRILALSATPGRRKNDVEEVIRNLFISNLEVRTEDSVDVVSYVYKRQMKTVVVQLGERLSEIRDKLLAISEPHVRNLIDNRLISGTPASITRNWLVMEHKRFRESLVNTRVPNQRELNSDFNICISVYHAIELLERHGLRVFLNNFDEEQNGGPKFVLILRPDLRRLIQTIRQDIGPNPFAFSDQCMVNGEIAAIPKNIDFGHPKFEIARDHVLVHFENNKDARVIIFCEYRESVMLMHRLLLQHRPMIRPRVFVGQGGTGSIRAVTQQQQINVMNDFRSGVSNALIATSVAEEGIDVGEVDLIVCFDINTSNPTRFIQRIGRTGRKKQGKVLLLATEGKEHSILKEVLSERNKLNKSISRGGEFASVLYKQAPRMVPTEFNPKCLKTYIPPTVAQEPKTKSKDAPKVMRDLRHFFKQKVVLDDEEKTVFEESKANRSIGIEDIMDRSSSKANNSTLQNVSALDTFQTSIDFSPPKNVDISNRTVKKIAKYIRNNSITETVDVQKSITSKRLSKESVQFMIEFSPDLLHNVWSRMRSIWKRGIDENSLPVKGISTEDRQAVRAYFQILNVLGTKENIASALANRSPIPISYDYSKYDFIFGEVQPSRGSLNNFEVLIHKFQNISTLFPSHQCSRESFAQSAVYDDDDIDEMNKPSGGLDEDNDQMINSKYMSQWVSSKNDECELPQRSDDFTNTKLLSISANIPKAIEKEESDDDVVFVGVAQQSTPLRPLKQLSLNFSETPIAHKTLVRSAKKSESKLNTETPLEKVKQSNELPTDFFDDQFDAIIAANSGMFDGIESSNVISRPIATDQDKQFSRNITNVRCTNVLDPKTSSGSNDSTPDNITNAKTCNVSAVDSTSNDIPACNKSSIAAPGSTNSLGSCSSSSQTVINNTVHPELVDIDFNAFSETFSEEIADKTQFDTKVQRISPDIFEDLSQPNPESADSKERSPIKPANSPPSHVSPCLITKKPLTLKEIRSKYFKPSQIGAHRTVMDQFNDSVVHAPTKIRTKRRRIYSDSDSSGDSPASRRKTVLPDKLIRRVSIQKPHLSRKRTNEFIENEAALSGSASEDELEQTMGCYMMDSVVVHDDDVENDNSVNMTQMYLQSLRSPSGNRLGAFKIPPRRQFNDTSKIFSQRVAEDPDYAMDSFVISDEGLTDEDQSICPLERAEAILKENRRAKRKARLIGLVPQQRQPAKKRRILRIHNSSEDDGDFA